MKQLKFIGIGLLVAIFIGGSFFVLAKVKTKILQEKRQASEDALIKQAQAFEAQGNLLKAKDVYQVLLKDYPEGKFVQENQKKIWDTNIKVLFSPAQTPDSKIYEVQPQDTVGKIAKNFGTTVELIMKSNNLKSDLIRPRMRLKVSTAKYSILVSKSQNTLTLKSTDEVLKVYQVSTGENNSTPVGTYKIVVKIIDPPWYKAGAIVPPGSPKNILGTRWMGFSLAGYGIHGTTEPDSIGKQVTAGCVRMINKEVEELYTIVPVGTDVTIVD